MSTTYDVERLRLVSAGLRRPGVVITSAARDLLFRLREEQIPRCARDDTFSFDVRSLAFVPTVPFGGPCTITIAHIIRSECLMRLRRFILPILGILIGY